MLRFSAVLSVLFFINCALPSIASDSKQVVQFFHLGDDLRNSSKTKNDNLAYQSHDKWLSLLSISRAGNWKEYADSDVDNQCFGEESKGYLKIFDDLSRKILLNHLDLAVDNKSVFSIRFSSTRLIGFSESSRDAYFSESSIDPDELYTWSEEESHLNLWFQWRRKKVASLVFDVAKLIRKKQGLFKIGVSSAWLSFPEWRKNYSCEDWPSWAKAGLMDEVVLEGEWEKPENRKLIALAREALKGTKVKMSVALDTRRDGKALDPLTQLLNLAGESFDGVYIKVEDDADLPRAQAFVKDVLPEFEFGLGVSEAVVPAPNGAPATVSVAPR